MYFVCLCLCELRVGTQLTICAAKFSLDIFFVICMLCLQSYLQCCHCFALVQQWRTQGVVKMDRTEAVRT